MSFTLIQSSLEYEPGTGDSKFFYTYNTDTSLVPYFSFTRITYLIGQHYLTHGSEFKGGSLGTPFGVQVGSVFLYMFFGVAAMYLIRWAKTLAPRRKRSQRASAEERALLLDDDDDATADAFARMDNPVSSQEGCTLI